MKVAIDTSPVRTGHVVRGVGIYTKNLLEALREVVKEEEDRIEILEGRREEADIWHLPYFEPYFITLPFFARVPVVVTIHDTTRVIYTDHYPPGIKGRLKFLYQKLALGRVAGVMTDSECSKKDIVRFLDVPGDRVHVVRLAPGRVFGQIKSEKELARVKGKYNLPSKFVLYVGDVDWNKNVLGLVRAVKMTNLPLVIVGKQAVSQDFNRAHIEMKPLVELLEKYGRDPQVIRLGFVPEEDLVGVYNLATLYCQPSFYEGFGLPVLEAMASGCPVVCSKRASLVEIGGDAVEWVNPDDTKQMAEVIRGVAESEEKKKELIKKGLVWVKQFNWIKTARQVIDIYKMSLK